jgi:AcrR family transcriptional regulator
MWEAPSSATSTALSIVDEEGLAALSMRRLAAAVGVKAPSLYNHVTCKEDLLDGVVGLMRSEIRLPDPVPEDWMDLMEGILTEYRRVLAAHPNMMPLAGRRLGGGDQSGLAYLVDQGFSPDQAVELWQSLVAFAVGFSMFSSGYAATGRLGVPENLAIRVEEWRDETFSKTLRMIMETYQSQKTESAAAQS